MDYLWSPWRFRYVSHAGEGDGCVFCEKAAAQPARDRENLLLFRARYNFILLNLYPYTTGHSMVIPYAHQASLEAVDPAALAEMMELAQRLQAALRSCYQPEGYNLGLNQGKCAGAGVADHLHLHILPRWTGDSSFMTTVGETRILPQDLLVTYDALAPYFPPAPAPLLR
jgi:ATP adenylyltransferase